ncbi:MAG: hypothetical protein K0U98_18295 [Deltaproteobacteria bacterium]|nr:hypothetical protein [Deltaproteobacteria bacterium]
MNGQSLTQLAPAALVFLAFSSSIPSSALAQSAQQKELQPAPLEVQQIAADLIYLNGGRSHGLQVGSRLEVLRGQEKIGEVEVAFVTDRSASCRIIESSTAFEVGNRLHLIQTSQNSNQEPTAPRRAPEKDLSTKETGSTNAEGSPAPSETTQQERPSKDSQSSSAETEPSKKAVVSQGSTYQKRRKINNLSGTISYRYQQLDDRSENPQDLGQSTFRLNLRLRDIGGSPYQFRLRVRGRESTRTQIDGPSDSERRDRLYELSIGYAPPAGKFSYQLGRLRSSPLLGFDYLDGALGEVKVSSRLGLGGFAGSRSEIGEFGFDSKGQAYGFFVHYENRLADKPFYSEVLLGGIGEYEDGEVNREYLSIYARLGSGNKWSIYQRADVDFNRDWRQDTSGSSQQISNLLLSGTYRISEKMRFGLSYDQRRRFRNLENRRTPEELFDDQLRDGVRLSLHVGQPRGWRASASVGLRRREGSSEDNTTFNSSIYHSNLFDRRLLLGLDFSGFQGESSEGYRIGLRSRKYFDGGHDLGLTLGTSSNRSILIQEDRSDRWIRLSGTARLPKRFFILGEYEVSEGDDFQGQRLILQLGYRL